MLNPRPPIGAVVKLPPPASITVPPRLFPTPSGPPAIPTGPPMAIGPPAIPTGPPMAIGPPAIPTGPPMAIGQPSVLLPKLSYKVLKEQARLKIDDIVGAPTRHSNVIIAVVSIGIFIGIIVILMMVGTIYYLNTSKYYVGSEVFLVRAATGTSPGFSQDDLDRILKILNTEYITNSGSGVHRFASFGDMRLFTHNKINPNLNISSPLTGFINARDFNRIVPANNGFSPSTTTYDPDIAVVTTQYKKDHFENGTCLKEGNDNCTAVGYWIFGWKPPKDKNNLIDGFTIMPLNSSDDNKEVTWSYYSVI